RERVATAQLNVQQATEGRQLELDAQKSKVAVLAAKTKQAEKDVERLESLSKLDEPLASQQQVEYQRIALTAAAAEQSAAEVALRRLEQTLAFQEQSAKSEAQAAEQTLAATEKGAGVQSLKSRLELSELKLKQTKILAPSAGVVLAVMAHVG